MASEILAKLPIASLTFWRQANNLIGSFCRLAQLAMPILLTNVFLPLRAIPLLISPDQLVGDGYLPASAVKDVPPFPTSLVDYGWVIFYKNQLFQKAFAYFKSVGDVEKGQAYKQFCADNAFWLDDFALFMALKNYHKDQDGGVWNKWPLDIAQRKPAAMKAWSTKLADEVELYKFTQFLFFGQWLRLKGYANERDIQIIGDIPIFVAFDSADVWSNPDLFFLKEDGSPEVIAGVPPDYFSETGQRWGNPLYRWDRMKAHNYAWWVSRLKMTFTQADVVRIDHFRGFEAYWADSGRRRNGRYRRMGQRASRRFL